MVTRAIKSAQTQVEQQNFEIRKYVLKYDEVMNQQRKVIYAERRRILEGENLKEQAHGMLVDVVTAYVDGATAEGYSEDWDLETLWTALKHAVPGRHRPPRPDRLRRDRRARRADPRGAARRADRGRRAGLRRAREAAGGDRRRGRDAPARAQRAAQRHRPQVARAPLRDGLSQGGHRPACDGAARPAGRVPARGLRHVQRHARRDEGGGRRLPVQRHRRGGARRACSAGGTRRRTAGLAEFAAEAAAKAQEGGVATKERQQAPALRAKGIDDATADLPVRPRTRRRCSAAETRDGGPRHAAPSRRERREARVRPSPGRASESHRAAMRASVARIPSSLARIEPIFSIGAAVPDTSDVSRPACRPGRDEFVAPDAPPTGHRGWGCQASMTRGDSADCSATQPICRATIRQRPSTTSTRPAMARTRSPAGVGREHLGGRRLVWSCSSTAAVRSRTRRSTAALSGPAARVSVKTMSSSGGVSIGRSCAIGLRRSITSSTRRSAASAKANAAAGGAVGGTARRAAGTPRWPVQRGRSRRRAREPGCRRHRTHGAVPPASNGGGS